MGNAFKLEDLIEEPRQNHVRGMHKVIEKLKERFEISNNRLSSSAALPTAVTDSEKMFEIEVKDFAY